MRVRGILVVALLLGASPVTAETSNELAAAVAPGQTVVDAAARVIALSLLEAHRDGTPDAGVELLSQMTDFVRATDAVRSLSENATYRREAAGALAFSLEVERALQDVPSAASAVAVVAFDCDEALVGASARDSLLVGIARLEASRTRLMALAGSPPAGIDATSLGIEAAKIQDWIAKYDIEPRCAFVPESFLTLYVVPRTVWPTGEVRIFGATNRGETIRLRSNEITLDEEVAVSGSRFTWVSTVPDDAPFGAATVVGNVSGRDVTATFQIDRAPSEIIVLPEGRYAPGVELGLGIRLVSPLRERVSNETLVVSGFQEREIKLKDGFAELRLITPEIPGAHTLTFTFEGNALVLPSTERATIIVAAALPPDVRVVTSAASFPLAAAVAAGAVVLFAFFLLLVFVQRRRRGSAPAALIPRPDPSPVFGGSDLIELVASILQWLRRAGKVRASDTLREVAHDLRGWGADAGDLTVLFERARYGGHPPERGALESARAFALSVVDRFKKVGP